MQLTDTTNRVYFEPTSHSYVLDGETLLMGVTGLMKKHGLSADYSGIPEATLRKAAEEGTAIHQEIQAYENGETVLVTDLISDYKKLGLKFIASEYQVTDFETVASAIDGVYAGTKKNRVKLVDYKTTQKYHRRALEWQLGIYKYLFERLNPGKVVESCHCLWIDKKARKIKDFVPVEPVTAAEVESLLEAEKNGLIYMDENEKPGVEVAIPQDELSVYVSNARKIAQLKAQIKEIEEAMKANDAKVLAYMEEHNLTELQAEGGVFKRRTASTQVRCDTAKLKEQFPAVFAKVAKEIQVKGSVSFKPNED